MWTAGFVQPGAGFLISVGTLLVLWQGSSAVSTGSLALEDLLAYFLYLGMFYGPITELNGLIDSIENIKASASRVFSILNLVPSIPESTNVIDPGILSGTISFEDVRFSYQAELPVLLGVNRSIDAGEKVALVGPSGTGKSTLTSLIPRFYDVDSGVIRVGGIDVSRVPLRKLRAHIAIVPQETFLFSGSVLENIAYGRLDASREEIIEAARRAYCNDFVMGFPDGFETLVGERGARLSGGQRQRIAIARAILKQAPILILDEATSSIDPESEPGVHAGLEALMEGRTVLIIAHRLSTAQTADRIVFVEGGRIIESGTHAGLMVQGGAYARMHGDASFYSVPASA